jgi:hypothetical protein
MMRKYLLGVFVVLAVLTVACKKDKNMVSATIIDTGDIAYKGCGYVMRLSDGTDLRPRYLPSTYQHDGMKVKVKFNRDGEGDVCDTYPVKKFMEVVDIVDIKKDLD